MKNFSFEIDFDDVLAPFCGIAVDIANEENPGLNATINDIKSWGNGEEGSKQSIIAQYYDDERILRKQKISDEARNFIYRLMDIGDVYINTAVSPKYAGLRYEQIADQLPEFPLENVILTFSKQTVKVDFQLDDGGHNILKSQAKYPILMRRPWNSHLSGVLAVNDYSEFFLLVDQIIHASSKKIKPTVPSVLALIGPSGCNKNAIADRLAEDGFAKRIHSVTTGMPSDNHDKVTEKEFSSLKFISHTVYAGNRYGIPKDAIEEALASGLNAVIPTDITGAIAMKKEYPVLLIFCKASHEYMIDKILDKGLDNEAIKYRWLSMEKELLNKELCDVIVNSERINDAVELIKGLFSQ
ncbi:guanylate kinase [Pseudobutyrivibrio sp. ACV-2]|uniref:5' nucleotidase, NT5C type n=1 Tax=Pseudobutyrivibrio sp. ACV-2 TaxID=1520801 RepID=UPI0008975FBF|nr:hypothetical protein [Pseudobutyrivibrio sp. ACV-2]SEA90168.1 guanylate kinase [Pseudobutyrivibrio sp. ACV-2]